MAASTSESLLTQEEAKTTNGPQTTTAQSPSLYERYFTNGWLFELLSVFVGLVAIIGLCVVLKNYDGKVDPRGNHVFGVNITVNTLVAILSTIGRAALLLVVSECIGQLKWRWYTRDARPLEDLDIFDRASRGAWGGLQLLWRVNFRQVASLGALLVIGGVAVDPLSQQLVHSRVQVIPGQAGSATLPAALEWSDGSQNTGAFIGDEDESSQTTLPTRAAFQNGIFSQNSVIPNLEPSCSSGNCTWPKYRSLAICNRVADVTSFLTSSLVTIPKPGRQKNSDETIRVTRWSLTDRNYIDGVSTRYFFLNTTARPKPIKGTYGNGVEENISLDFTDSKAFKDSPRPIANAFLIYTNTRTIDTTHPASFGAAEFVLEWCVRDFDTVVSKGEPTTVPGKTFPGFSKLDTSQPSAYIEATPDGGGANKPVYTVDFSGHYSLQRYLAKLLTGTVNSTAFTGDTSQAMIQASNEATAALFQPFDMVGGLINGKDPVVGRGVGMKGLRAILDNISTSLTNLVRTQSGGKTRDTIKGSANELQVYIEVQWGWIAAPVILLVGTIILLASAVISSGGRRTPEIWKSSSLPLLRVLDRDVQVRAPSDMQTTSSTEHWAKGVAVQLTRLGDAGVWKLRRHE